MIKQSLLIITIIVISCNQPSSTNKNCLYSIDSLFSNYDSTKFEISRIDGFTDVIDAKNSIGERGIYKFDQQGALRFYGFLFDIDKKFSSPLIIPVLSW